MPRRPQDGKSSAAVAEPVVLSAQLAQTKLLLGLRSYLGSPGRNARLAQALLVLGPWLPGPKRKSGAGQLEPKRRAAWNKGRKHSKTNKQHVFVPREQLQLFFAVALFFAGPTYCAVLWIALVSSRRIGETLLLKGTNVRLRGGEDHDAPHILFERGEGDQGNGKLPEERVVARLSQEAVDGLTRMKKEGLERQCLPALEPYRKTHPKVFQNRRGGGLTALRQETFAPDWESADHVFPSKTKEAWTQTSDGKTNRLGCTPSRQAGNVRAHKPRTSVESDGSVSRQPSHCAWSHPPHQRCSPALQL